jgi:hypothetical protein
MHIHKEFRTSEGRLPDQFISNADIQEPNKHYVPEVVARFEAPITARAFRRLSSPPLPIRKARAPVPIF